MQQRTAQKARQTAETNVNAAICLEGSGEANIQTGIGFLDHMLAQLARHSLIDITIKAEGDLHIDCHHTVEDTGIVLGSALSEAVGDCRGLTRFGHSYVPMDECLTRVCLDISKRPYLVWNVKFSQPYLGNLATEMLREWFYAFAINAGITLHVENLYGINNHHIAESCFKALAQALRQALTIDQRSANRLPTTKDYLGAS